MSSQVLKIQGEEPELPIPPSPVRKAAPAKAPAAPAAEATNGKRSGERSGDRSARNGGSSSSSSSRAPREGGSSRSGARRTEFGSSAETKMKVNSSEPWGKETLPPAADKN